MSHESVNYWKFATIGILLVGATVAATLLLGDAIPGLSPRPPRRKSTKPQSLTQRKRLPRQSRWSRKLHPPDAAWALHPQTGTLRLPRRPHPIHRK